MSNASKYCSGRDMMKQKMLFPLLMLVKLKLKALTPIMLAIVGLKATKALVLSKIAVLLVVGFLIVQVTNCIYASSCSHIVSFVWEACVKYSLLGQVFGLSTLVY